MSWGYEEHERRIRNLLRRLRGLEPEEDESDAGPSSEASLLVMTVSEAVAALVRNGTSPKAVKEAVGAAIAEMAEQYPTLNDIVTLWLADGEDAERRLEDFQEYNAMLRSGEYKEGKPDAGSKR